MSPDIIIIIIVLIIIGLAIFYLIKSKKNGSKCIGCPGGSCHPKQKENKKECCCSKEENKK